MSNLKDAFREAVRREFDHVPNEEDLDRTFSEAFLLKVQQYFPFLPHQNSIKKKRCFFIGHRDAPSTILRQIFESLLGHSPKMLNDSWKTAAVYLQPLQSMYNERKTVYFILIKFVRILYMARASTKENKNIYHKTRESLQLSREAASELLESITPERIEKIENERSLPHPDEVLVMAEKYKQPSLCNYYCANQCPIGQEYVPEVKIKDLSQIVLEMLASLNAMSKQKERLIEITVDGKITGDELEDFIFIQEELERISIAVEMLQLWSERMLATGVIDEAQYNAHKNKQG